VQEATTTVAHREKAKLEVVNKFGCKSQSRKVSLLNEGSTREKDGGIQTGHVEPGQKGAEKVIPLSAFLT